MVAIGVALLLTQWNVISFEMIWKLWLPVLLVIIGVSVIFSSNKKADYSEEIEEVREADGDEDKSKKLNGFAAFSGTKYNAEGETFLGGELTAVFGGLDYDFRNSTFTGKTVLDVSAIFGGVDIYFPENVVVKVKPTAIFGGVGNKRGAPETETDETPVVYVNAIAMFGGVTIK